MKVRQVESILLSVYKEEGEKGCIKEFLLILRNYILNTVVSFFILLRNPWEKKKKEKEVMKESVDERG